MKIITRKKRDELQEKLVYLLAVAYRIRDKDLSRTTAKYITDIIFELYDTGEALVMLDFAEKKAIKQIRKKRDNQ